MGIFEKTAVAPFLTHTCLSIMLKLLCFLLHQIKLMKKIDSKFHKRNKSSKRNTPASLASPKNCKHSI